MKVESDERATALLGYCPHCPIHEGIRSYRQLVELTREFRQCPQCLRTYYVPVAAPPASPAHGAPDIPALIAQLREQAAKGNGAIYAEAAAALTALSASHAALTATLERWRPLVMGHEGGQ